jgi:hypothetical protein
MSPYSPSHTFFLDTIKGIYNKDASLFIHLKKVVSIHLPCIIRSKLGDFEFQDDYWKYCTSMVDELGLRMHAIPWVHIKRYLLGPYQHQCKPQNFMYYGAVPSFDYIIF